MVTGIKSWLEGAFDYAGLFPPASLGITEAVEEYVALQDSEAGFLVDRFLIPASRFGELTAQLDAYGIEKGFPCSLIGSPFSAGSIDADWKACRDKRVDVTGYELKCAPGLAPKALFKEIKKSAAADILGDDFYLEFAWDEHQEDNLLEAAGSIEEIGFKARTGGLSAGDFPTVEQLAVWIVTTASLDAPVKFTAGLHEALRYHDQNLHVMRHGFLNVMTAFVLARVEDLVVDEVASVLSETNISSFEFGKPGLGHGLTVSPWEAVEESMDWFRGIGSCSIIEPLESLGRLRLL
ncbi:MAG: hypothetical protein ABUL72_01485 [Armatimonadota bacterium]